MLVNGVLPDSNGNQITVDWFPGTGTLDLTAEWSGDIYGEGVLSLSTEQMIILRDFLISLDLGENK